MPNRSSTPRDVNELAAQIVREATSEATSDKDEAPAPTKPEKDPLAVELGRRGGLKGGPARAAKLSAERRKEIAREAAKTRWKRHK